MRKGISLIALIITVIVIIILASVIILSLRDTNSVDSANAARVAESRESINSAVALYLSSVESDVGGNKSSREILIDSNEYKIVESGTLIIYENASEKMVYRLDYDKLAEKLKINVKVFDNSSNWYIDENGKVYLVYTSKEDVATYLTEENGNILSSVSNYVKYTGEKFYTITLNANEGSVNISLIKEKEGQNITLPVPTREEYKFLGWYTSLIDGTKVNYTSMPSEDVVLYAMWGFKYTLTLNANGGESEITMISDTEGEAISLPTPTRENHRFLGWFTEAEGGDKVEYTSMPAESKNLYAHWEAKVTLTFDANSGYVDPAYLVDYSGENISLPTPTRDNYKFLGWYTDASGGTKVTYDTMPNSSTTIYAQWEAKVTLTYNANGGSVSPSSVTNFSGESISLPTPTRSNYQFDGWYTASSGGSRVTYTTMPSSTTTVYAHWTAQVCSIGSTKYTTLAAAINAVTAGSSSFTTITMIRSVTLPAVATIPSNKKIAINLAGYTISRSTSQTIVNNGTLRIYGSGTVSNSAGIAIQNAGTFTTYSGTPSISSSGGDAFVNTAGTATLSCGSISSTAGRGVYVSGGTVGISGSTVTTSTTASEAAVYVASGATANISSGTISSQSTAGKTGVLSDGTLNITGGTISSSYYCSIIARANSTFSMSGSPSIGLPNKASGATSYPAQIYLSATTSTISGGSYDDVVLNAGKLTISNATFSSDRVNPLYVVAGATLVVNSGTFTSSSSMALNNKGTAYINGGSYTSTASYSIRSDDTMYLNAGTFSSKSGYNNVYAAKGTVYYYYTLSFTRTKSSSGTFTSVTYKTTG